LVRTSKKAKSKSKKFVSERDLFDGLVTFFVALWVCFATKAGADATHYSKRLSGGRSVEMRNPY
jgi:hypothetical protein